MRGEPLRLNMPMDQQSWRLRLREQPPGGQPGQVLGAGVLFGQDLVLTCAHVLPGRTDQVRVEFPLLKGKLQGVSRTATVLDEYFVPRHGKHEGDLALLRLTSPAPVPSTVVLDRDPVPYDTRVMVDGFPRGRSGGFWVDAQLKGPGGHGDEWVQLNPVGYRDRDPRGFSGAGVTEAGSGRLIGIMVAVYGNPDTEEPLLYFYMIPGATIAGHLPLVAAHHMTGSPVIPPQLSVAPEAARTGRPLGLQRTLTRWLHRDADTWDTETVFVREDDAEAASALRTTLNLADRERSPALSTADTRRSGDGTVPRPGTIDLAVAAAGMSHEELTRALEPRQQLSSVAIVSADRSAATPQELAGLLRTLADRGVRLLLVLNAPEPALTQELLPPGRARLWLARLAARTDRLSDAERSIKELHRRLTPRVTRLPAVPDPRSVDAQLWTAQLTAEWEWERDGDEAALLEKLSYAEQAVEHFLLAAERAERELRTELDRLHGLRGLLAAEQARLSREDRAEDAGATVHYREAQRLLRGGPSDLDDVQRAVDVFVRSVHRLLDEEPAPQDSGASQDPGVSQAPGRPPDGTDGEDEDL